MIEDIDDDFKLYRDMGYEDLPKEMINDRKELKKFLKKMLRRQLHVHVKYP